jgi:hypothetical protein
MTEPGGDWMPPGRGPHIQSTWENAISNLRMAMVVRGSVGITPPN